VLSLLVAAALGADATTRMERRPSEQDGTSLTDQYPPPKVTARGWLVYDARADEPIAGVDAATARPIASLTKLMTAYVVVRRLDLDDVVTIPTSINDLPADASRMDARAGEQWVAGDLLKATLVYSANDAALALATHVGKDGGEQAFIDLMNEQADKLQLSDTSFASSTGLDAPGKSSTSTPIDLVKLTEAALAQEPIASAVRTPLLQLKRPNGTPLDPLRNRNPLLGTYDGVDGVKTGFTDSAGYMLVVHQLDEKTGGELIVVTFASDSERTRVSDSRQLLDWARPLRQQLLVVEGGTPLGSVPVQRSDEHVDVFACDDLTVSGRVGQRLMQEVALPRSIAPPVTEGDEIGTLSVRTAVPEAEDDDDRLLPSTVPICAGDTIAARSTRDQAIDYARDWRSAWNLGIDEVEDTWSSLWKQAS
jgi:D-alanyl-D-alanine carboxypeptidase (penicillin-binding protein 5/6)